MWLWWTACRAPIEPPPDTRPDPTGTPTLTFPEEERPKNLLFVSMDTTRRDHLDPWATDGQVRSPFLASLFAQGLTLDDHLQCSNWTFASTSCTLRGQLMEETGFYPRLDQQHRAPLPDDQPTLARRLGEHGFRSVLMSSNDWLSPQWNNAQGYTEFRDLSSGDTQVILNVATVTLRDEVAAGGPWFVHVHLIDPHPAYALHEGYTDAIDALPPAPASWDLDSFDGHYDTVARWQGLSAEDRALLKQHLEARYSAEIRYMDDRFAEFWEGVNREHLLDDTLVVFWNDHGEQIFDHGHESHAFDLHHEENDGYAVFLGPGVEPGRYADPTHSVDLVPTVLDALGFPPDGDPTLPGYVLGTAPPGRPRFAASVARLGPLVSVVQGGQKLIWDLDDGTARFYEHASDPTEDHDRFDPDDPDVLRLWGWLKPRGDLVAPLATDFDVRFPSRLPR